MVRRVKSHRRGSRISDIRDIGAFSPEKCNPPHLPQPAAEDGDFCSFKVVPRRRLCYDTVSEKKFSCTPDWSQNLLA